MSAQFRTIAVWIVHRILILAGTLNFRFCLFFYSSFSFNQMEIKES